MTAALINLVLPLALLAGQMAARDVSVASALSELNRGRILQGIDQFRQIIRTDPANDQAYFYLATLYTQLNEYAAAERFLQRAMELKPNEGLHYYQLGLIRYRQKQWQAALGQLQRALDLGAGNNEAAVWRAIGDVQVELFDRDAALQAYETAVRIQPRDAGTRLGAGRFYIDRSQPERAIPHLLAALEIDSSMRAAYPLLGRAYRQNGDLPAAVAVLKKALDGGAPDQESRYLLGQTLLAIGRLDEGRREMERYEAVRQQVEDANRNYQAGVSRLEAGDLSEAEKLLRDAVRQAPNYGPALLSLGKLLLDRGSAAAASGFLKQAVEASPLNAAAWFHLGSAYFKTGKLSEAFEAARMAVVLDEEDPGYQQLLTEIQQKMPRGKF
jgi:tetratricopeptide (TPR) repeat protein